MLVVSDTTLLRYLITIEHQFVLRRLFERILVPQAVQEELQHPRTPLAVRSWMTAPPAWLEVCPSQQTAENELLRLGAGEREAILLAQARHADLILMDDWAGRQAAEARSLNVIGTLRVLEYAAERGLLDLPSVLTQLQHANFYMSSDLVQELIARDAARQTQGSETEEQNN
jgi:predicted nucleic acid-binding protein